MSRIRSLRQRVDRLERLPEFQPPKPPPSVFEKIRCRALRPLSDEELHLLNHLMMREEAGEDIETLSPTEVAAIERLNESLDIEARRMGFESFNYALQGGKPKPSVAATVPPSKPDPWWE